MPATTINRSALFLNYTHSNLNVEPAACNCSQEQINATATAIKTLDDAKAFILAYMKFSFQSELMAEVESQITEPMELSFFTQAKSDIAYLSDLGFVSFVDVGKTGYDRMVDAGIDKDLALRVSSNVLMVCGFLSNFIRNYKPDMKFTEEVMDVLEFIASPEPTPSSDKA